MMTSLHIKSIEFQAYHGAFEEERALLRRFQVDVSAMVDVAAAKSDHLADTVNWYEMSDTIVQISTQQTFALLEKLATTLADTLLARWSQIHRVEIQVRKLLPSCPGNPAYTAVQVHQQRQDSSKGL